jgi:hypothetical protein
MKLQQLMTTFFLLRSNGDYDPVILEHFFFTFLFSLHLPTM